MWHGDVYEKYATLGYMDITHSRVDLSLGLTTYALVRFIDEFIMRVTTS